MAYPISTVTHFVDKLENFQNQTFFCVLEVIMV